MKGTLRTATALPNHRPQSSRRTTRAPALTSALLALVLLGAAATIAQSGDDVPPAGTPCPPGYGGAPPPGHADNATQNGTNQTQDPAAESCPPTPVPDAGNDTKETNGTPVADPVADDGFGTQPVEPCPCHHPDLAVSLDANLDPGGYGEDGRLDYRITLTNVGGAPATDATLGSLLPDVGGNWTLGGPDGASCQIDGAALSCTFPEVLQGEVLRIVVSSAVCDMDCGAVVHTVTAFAPGDDEASNDTASAVVEREDCEPGA